MEQLTENNAKPTPPETLTQAGKSEWERIVTLLPEINELDYSALEMLCLHWQLFLQSVKDVSQNGVMVDVPMANGTTSKTKNPAVNLITTSTNAYISLCGKFGITPSERARLAIQKKKTSKDEPLSHEDDPIWKLLNS
jgi:P27 family predicted phage terminase small subunit